MDGWRISSIGVNLADHNKIINEIFVFGGIKVKRIFVFASIAIAMLYQLGCSLGDSTHCLKAGASVS